MAGDDLFGELPEQAKARAEAAPVGAPRLREPQRNQIALRAVDIESLIGEDHPVRLIWSYVEELDLPHQLPLTVELVKSDSHQPTVIVHDEAQRTDTIYSDNGDITVNNLGGRGQISWSTTVQANGVQIYTEGGPEHPDRKDIRYPDGTTISVAGSQIKDNQGNPKSWTTTINSPNFHDQTGQLNLTLDSDITDGQTQLPPTFSFQVVPGGPSYEIDNRTLTLSVPGGGKYYMNGVQPEIDEPSTPLVQQTATATPFSDPPDLFSDIATSDSTPVPDSKR